MQIAGRDSLWQELQCTGMVPIIYVARWKPDPGHPEENDIVMNSFAVSLMFINRRLLALQYSVLQLTKAPRLKRPAPFKYVQAV